MTSRSCAWPDPAAASDRLLRTKKGADTALITFVQIAIGSGPGLSCARCAAQTSAMDVAPREAGQIVDEITDAARSWSHGPGPNVTFIGLEPFAHPALPELVSGAVAAGVVRVRLRTDGGALATGANAAGALAAGVRQLEVVALAAGEDHDRLTGRSGLASACDAGVRAFVRVAAQEGHRVAVTGLVPVCRHSAGHAADAVAWLAAMGAVAVHIDASACRESDRHLVVAALDTAAVNGVSASVSDGPFAPSTRWSHRAWSEIAAS